MNNWLQNIKGQISEIASEVLQDVTHDEVEDPQTELQVEKKRFTESERMLLEERSKNEILEKKVSELESQLYHTNVENDAIKERFETMIQDRDYQIRQLQIELSQLQNRTADGFEDITLENTNAELGQHNSINASVFQLAIAEEFAKAKEKYEKEALETAKKIAEYEEKISSLVESCQLKENEVQRITNLVSSITTSKHASDAEDGADSSSSNDWERMGTDLSCYKNKTGKEISEVATQTLEEISTSFGEGMPNLSDLQAEFSESFLALSSTQHQLRDSIEENKRLSKKFNEETSNLQHQLEIKDEELKQLKTSSEIEDTEGIQKLTKENDFLKKKIDIIVKEHEQTLNQKVSEFEALTSELKKQLTMKDEELRTNSQEISESNTQWNNVIEEMRQEFAAKFQLKQSEVEALEATISKLQNELLLNNEECEERIKNESKHEIVALNEEISELKHKIQELSESYEIASEKDNSQIQILNKHLETKNLQISQLESFLEQEKTLSHNLRQSIDQLEIELDKVRNDLNTIKNSNIADSGNKEIEDPSPHSSVELLEKIEENEQLKLLLDKTILEKNELAHKLDIKMKEADVSNRDLQDLIDTHKKCQENYNCLLKNSESSKEDNAIKEETIRKLNIELNRLRDHLLTVEEISSKEALAAEEREAELRVNVAKLKEALSANDIDRNASNFEEEITTLKAEIVSLEETNSRLRSLLSAKECTIAENTKSISNLQRIVKELDIDQKHEKQEFENKLRLLKEENEKKVKDIEKFAQVEKNFIEKNQNFEQTIEFQSKEIEKYKSVIDELENQLEEVSHTANEKAYRASSDSYKIDDATLRQLFLSFFLSEKAKQPEIAIVMTKILGYGNEEQNQIREAVERNYSGSASWLSLLYRSQKINDEPSLTEQFIRFLEQESRVEAARTLPVQHESSDKDRIRMNEEPITNIQDPRSFAELKSILES